MAIALFAILTHCVDDISCTEMVQLVESSRVCFVELCELIGLKLDMSKTIQPCTGLIYLGLSLTGSFCLVAIWGMIASFRYLSLENGNAD